MRKNDCKVACGLFYGGAVCGSCAAKTAKFPRHFFAEVSRPLFASGGFAWRGRGGFMKKIEIAEDDVYIGNMIAEPLASAGYAAAK